MRILSFVLFATVIQLTVACGSGSGGGGAPSGSGDVSAPSKPCVGVDSGGWLENISSNRNINANNDGILLAYPAGSQRTLCEILVQKKLKFVVAQFSGVYCLECQTQAKELSSFLKAENLTSEASHAVVFVDPAADGIPSADFTSFMSQYAPNSLALYDPDKDLMRKSAADPKTLQFGIGLIVRSDGAVFAMEKAEGARINEFKDHIRRFAKKK